MSIDTKYEGILNNMQPGRTATFVFDLRPDRVKKVLIDMSCYNGLTTNQVHIVVTAKEHIPKWNGWAPFWKGPAPDKFDSLRQIIIETLNFNDVKSVLES